MSMLAALPPTRARLDAMALWRNLRTAHQARRHGEQTVLAATLGTLRNIATLGATETIRERARREAAELGLEDRG